MTLDKATLKASIKAKLKDLSDRAAGGELITSEIACDELSGTIADAVDVFVKTGTVAFSSGAVTGTCPGGGGPLSGGAGAGGTIS